MSSFHAIPHISHGALFQMTIFHADFVISTFINIKFIRDGNLQNKWHFLSFFFQEVSVYRYPAHLYGESIYSSMVKLLH